MAYVIPNSKINICHGIPLDTTQKHTLYFANPETQLAYFESKKKYALTSQMYQRVSSNRMRVDLPADSLYDCNYLYFQNTSFGDKWFFAFITKITYINNSVSEIEYEIDELQSWLLSGTLGECKIIRTHTPTDEIGEYLAPEPYTLGDYISSAFSSTGHLDEWCLVIVTSDLPDGYPDSDAPLNARYSGIPSGLRLMVYQNTQTGIEYASKFLNAMIDDNKQDAIVTIILAPNDFFADRVQNPDKPIKYDINIGTPSPLIDGYTPKNNKLLTYPYIFLQTYTVGGSGNGIFRYEWFSARSANFELVCAVSPAPDVLLIPKNYMRHLRNYEQILSMSGFPQISWVTDTFRAWLAQNGVATGLQIGGQVIGAVASGISGNIPGLLTSGVALASTINSAVQSATRPDTSRGGLSGYTAIADSIQDFFFTHKTIQAEYARMIDDNFTKFGYAIGKIQKPVLNVRPHWTYVETEDCIFTGDVPNSAKIAIQNYFNSGITFWKNASEVGNYELDNAPVSSSGRV